MFRKIIAKDCENNSIFVKREIELDESYFGASRQPSKSESEESLSMA